MAKNFRVGEWVTLPVPFSELTGRVIRVYSTGPNAIVTVEYPLEEGTRETLTKGFLASQLRRAPLVVP